MKKIHVFLTLVVAFFAVVMYFTSCQPDNNTVDCTSTGCLNGGQCVNNSCSCPVGYEGPECGDLSRAKFMHTYGSSTKDCLSSAYTITISPKTSSDTAMLIKNVANLGSNTFVYALMTGQASFVIPNQHVQGLSTYTMSGNATQSGSQISLSYTYDSGSGSPTTCNATFNAQ